MTHLTGTGPLTRLVLRRDRVRLAIWLAAITLLTYSQVAGLKGVYPDRQSLAEAGQLVQDNAAFIAMAGPPVALDTLGGRTAFEIAAFGMVLAALMNIFLVTRHLRGDEEAGRAELLRSTVVGRHASITAVLATALLADAVLGGLLFAVLIGTGLPAWGSAALATGIAGVGLLFAGIAAVSSQVTEGTRAASGIAGAALAVSFVLRAIGDVGDGRLSWLSPLGWGQALRPYGGERWWVLALMAAALVALTWSAYRINSRRDLGAGIVRPRTGPARAEPRLLSPTGLAVRLHRGALAGWTLALLLAGVAYGSISGDVEDFVGDNETFADIMAQAGGDLVESFLATTAMVLALIATAYSVQATLRMRSEEQAGRAEPVLAGALSRWRWAGSHLQVVVAGTLVVLAAAGLGTGITYGLVDGDAGQVPRLLAASLVHAPAALVVVGVTVALYGFVPRFAVAGWALVAALFVMGFFGDILSLPEWLLDLSPFQHVPSLPAEEMAVLPLVLLSVLAAALIGLGLVGLRRRDLQT